MARYVTKIRTPVAPADAFAFVADLRRFEDWDPGVVRSVQVEGDGAGLGAAYEVTVAAVPRDLTLRYETRAFDPGVSTLVVAESALFTSEDAVSVEPWGEGSLVTYDADLRLKGPLALFDLGLKLVFGRIGDRAAAGLRRALDGEAAR